MQNERWQRAKELFAAAIEQEPENRLTFLCRECAGDKELECEVGLLLQHHESPHEFLATPVARLDDCFPEGRPMTLAAGSQFGRYTVCGVLGTGGMGEVYLAEDTRLYRKVALKLLPPWLSFDTESVSRFQQEALAASALNHPNVPVVYEADEVDGLRYIATEFVQGSTLSERIAGGCLEWREAIGIAVQVGQALIAAHSAGIIHRDVKPSNILIRKDGTVKLADFGIAKLLERTGSAPNRHRVATAVGTPIGTPAYMSPEQFSGEPVDMRTDVWSLAVVLQEMILGPPPSGTNRLRGSRQCPNLVSKAIENALALDRDRRCTTVQEFVKALEAASRPQLRLWLNPIKNAQYGVVAALLCLLVMAAYFVLKVNRATVPEVFHAYLISKLTTSGKVTNAAISQDGRYVVYVVADPGRQTIRLREVSTGADVERIAASHSIYSDLTFSNDGHSFFYLGDPGEDLRTLYRAPVVEGSPQKLLDDVDSPPAISPDGRQIEFSRGRPSTGDTVLLVASADGSGLREVATRPYARAFLSGGACWSADGKSIFTGAFEGPERAGITQVQISNGKQTQVSRDVWRWVGRVSSISAGRVLVFPAAGLESISPELYQLSLGEDKVTAITADLARYMTASTSARSIVTVRDDMLSAIWITNLKDPSRPRRITPPSGRYWQLAWAPDGSLLSQTGEGRELNIWRVFKDGSHQQITSGPHIDWGAVVSADGKRLAFVSNRVGGLHLWTSDSQGRFLHEVMTGKGTISSPSFAPDGSIVYGETNSGSSAIFKITPEEGVPVRVLSEEAEQPAVSPNGRYLACKLKEHGGRWESAIVDMQTSRVIRTFPDIPYESGMRWTADGKALAYIKTQNGVSNIAAKRLIDGAEKQLTKFEEGVIFSFDMARDGRELAFVRGIASSDVLLLEADEKEHTHL